MIYLTKDDLISINHTQIGIFGGRFISENNNILNENSLDYLLNIVEEDYYPSIYEKAAAYTFYIIKDHIFEDGCKRTGMMSALVFLIRNNIETQITDYQIDSWPLKIENNKLKIVDLAKLLEKISS